MLYRLNRLWTIEQSAQLLDGRTRPRVLTLEPIEMLDDQPVALLRIGRGKGRT